MKKWRAFHRWIGLVVGIQVLLWISGGVVMSVIPIETVRGNHLIDRNVDFKGNSDSSLTMANFADINWLKIERMQRIDLPFVVVTDLEETRTYRTVDNNLLTMLSKEQALQTAQAMYLGSGKGIRAELLNSLPREVNHLSEPVYQVTFDDWINTQFYLHPLTGEVKSVRSDIWRFYDFFWMLHIMDYEERHYFNNPLVITAAIIALLFTFSGFILLYHNLIRPKWKKTIRRIA